MSREDYGNSLDEVERLLVQHDNMRRTVDKFIENLDSLSSFAEKMKSSKSENSLKMRQKFEDIQARLDSAKSLVHVKLKMLQESQLYFDFLGKKSQVNVFLLFSSFHPLCVIIYIFLLILCFYVIFVADTHFLTAVKHSEKNISNK